MDFIQKYENSYLIIPKLVYLVVNLQIYGFHQIRPAFARERFGISDSKYGTFTGYIQFITFFTNVMIGNISDRTRNHRSILLLIIASSTAVFICFYLCLVENPHSMMFFGILLFYSIFNNPKQPLLDKIMIEHLENSSDCGPKTYGRQRLWGTLSLPLSTYVSEWCISLENGKSNFNNLIHYNIVATVLALSIVVVLVNGKSPVATRFVDCSTDKKLINMENANTNPESQIDPTFNHLTSSPSIDQTDSHYMNVVANQKMMMMNDRGINHHCVENHTVEISNHQSSVGRCTAIFKLLKNKDFMFFILIIFSNAITRSALSMYLSIFHREILQIKPYSLPEQWPKSLRTVFGVFSNKPLATLTTFGVIFEVIVLFFSESILTKLGYFWPLIIAQLVSLIRFVAYYLISSGNKHVYGLSCAFELLRGIYFGLIHISSVHIAHRLAPPRFKATSQMIYQSTFSALGSLISGCIFGSLFRSKAGSAISIETREGIYKQIFLINSFVTLTTVIICFIKYGFVDKVLFDRKIEEAKLNSYTRIV